MDPAIIAAIIGVIGAIIAAYFGWWLQRDKNTNNNIETTSSDNATLNETQKSANKFSQRYLEYPSHYRFIKSLPKMKAVVFENAQEGWDTGVTADMRQASYDVIDFLEYAWLRLAAFYPENHWAEQNAESYIRNYIKNRFTFHWSKHEPDGPGTGGTIVGILTGSDVMSDMESLIDDTVLALFMYNDEFDYDSWKKEWTR